MLHSKAFSKKTRGGAVVKVVREHYLRDDIRSGTPLDPECPATAHVLSPEADYYLVVDTNVALHQMDMLEHAAIADIILPSTVLNETKARAPSAYARLRALTQQPTKRAFVFANENHRGTYVKAEAGESPNDRNDRAIRRVAAFYAALVPKESALKVILLSDDVENRRRAEAEGLEAWSCRELARRRDREGALNLEDIVARFGAEKAARAGAGEEEEEGRAGKRTKIYPEHKKDSELLAGIKAGRYHKGKLRASRSEPWEARVSSASVGRDILLRGPQAINRAMEGDVVVVELLPEAEWLGEARTLGHEQGHAAPLGMMQEAEDDDSGSQIQATSRLGETAAAAAGESSSQHRPLSNSSHFPTGRVVGVLRRAWRSRGYCCSIVPPSPGSSALVDGSPTSVLVSPVDQRFPAVRITTRQAATLADARVVVAVDAWDTVDELPRGHFVKSLGPISDRSTETDVLLHEHDVDTSDFSPAVEACVPESPWSVSDADRMRPSTRRDLRDLCVCSVDPPGCKDIDDALHARYLGPPTTDPATGRARQRLEVGVHIADVTHFVPAGSPIDLEAAHRSTSTYLVGRRIDMLPKKLTEEICSLRADVERLAFSAMFVFEREGEEEDVSKSASDAASISGPLPQYSLLSTRFTKSVIRSRAALTYEAAQRRLEDPHLEDEVTSGLRLLAGLARFLRRARFARGALALASPEVKFEISSDAADPASDAADSTAAAGDPTVSKVGMYQTFDTNSMVEEMMLLANCAVAKRILEAYPDCAILRRHAVPPERQFEPLLRAARAAGFEIDVGSSSALAASLDQATRPGDPFFNRLLRILATRCMTQALYCSSGEVKGSSLHHYGLAESLYTHFTSPIRRYADVLVHRLLAAAEGVSALPEVHRRGDAVKRIVQNMNDRHRGAQLAGRASVELHTLIFFANREVVADARVVAVKENGLSVFVPKIGIEGPVFLVEEGQGVDEKQKKETWTYDEERQCLICAGKTITVFDPVAVRIAVEEGVGRRRKLKLALVERAEIDPQDLVENLGA